MATASLAAAIKAVDWGINIESFLKEPANVLAVESANKRLAIWSKQLEQIENGSAALCFVREMQVAGHHVAALLALGLYKPATGGMRTVVETALYYSYFRSHLSELSTLVRDPKYYISKEDLLAYHKLHTPGFVDLQGKLGLVTGLTQWYSRVSAILHGQVPGIWVTHTSLSGIKHNSKVAAEAVKTFVTGEDLVHKLFLCTVARELWGSVSTPAKQELLSGLSGQHKTELGLDSA